MIGRLVKVAIFTEILCADDQTLTKNEFVCQARNVNFY